MNNMNSCADGSHTKVSTLCGFIISAKEVLFSGLHTNNGK